jgi:hypothetical protein
MSVSPSRLLEKAILAPGAELAGPPPAAIAKTALAASSAATGRFGTVLLLMLPPLFCGRL